MNSQIHTLLLPRFIEDQIRTAADARLLPEYQREATRRRDTGRRWARAASRPAHR